LKRFSNKGIEALLFIALIQVLHIVTAGEHGLDLRSLLAQLGQGSKSVHLWHCEIQNYKGDFVRVLPEIRSALHSLGLDADRIPLIAAGGINSPQKVAEAFAAGASGVQAGTPFAVTEEGDAHPTFKRVLAEARREDIAVFMSVAGLPARAVRTPWLARYLEKEQVLQRRAVRRRQCTLAWDCLAQCGLRDGLPRAGQFCIDHHLAAALRGDTERGLFFRGSEPLPFGSEIRPVRDLVAHLLG